MGIYALTRFNYETALLNSRFLLVVFYKQRLELHGHSQVYINAVVLMYYHFYYNFSTTQ